MLKFLNLVGARAMIVGAVGVLTFASAWGANCVWTGAGDGTTWSDAANWDGNAVPTTTDSVIFDSAAGGTVNLTANVTVSTLCSGAGNWRFTGSKLSLSAQSPFPWSLTRYPTGLTTFENEVSFAYSAGQRQVYGGKVFLGPVSASGTKRFFFCQQYNQTFATVPADAQTAVFEFAGANQLYDFSAMDSVGVGANTEKLPDAAQLTVRNGATLKAKRFFDFRGSTVTVTNGTIRTTTTGTASSFDTLSSATVNILAGGTLDCAGKFDHGQGKSTAGAVRLFVRGGTMTTANFTTDHKEAEVEISQGGSLTCSSAYELRNGAAATCLVVKDGTLDVNGTLTVGSAQALNLVWVHGGTAPRVTVNKLVPSTTGNTIAINMTDEDGMVPGRTYTVLTESAAVRVVTDYTVTFNGVDAATVGVLSVTDGVLSFRVNDMGATWTGAAGDNLFSSPGNWSGNAVPGAGAVLYFPSVAAGTTLTNDLADLAPAYLTFGADCGAITLAGNALTGLLDVANASASVQTLACPITYAQYLVVHQPAAHLAFPGGVTAEKPYNASSITDLYGNFTFTYHGDSATDYSATLDGCWRPGSNSWTFNVKRGSSLTLPGALYINAKSAFFATVEEDGTLNIGTFINRYNETYFTVHGTLNIDHLTAYGYQMFFSSSNSTGTVNVNTFGVAANVKTSLPCARLNIGAGGIVHESSVSGIGYTQTKPLILTDGQILGSLADWSYTERTDAAEQSANYYLSLGVSNTLDTAGHAVTFAHTVQGTGPLAVTGGGQLTFASLACRAWSEGLVFRDPMTFAVSRVAAVDLNTPIFRAGDALPETGVLTLDLTFSEPVVGTFAISAPEFGATEASLEHLQVVTHGETEVTPSLRLVDGVLMLTLTTEDRSALADWIWTPVDGSTALDAPGNWSRTNVVATTLATAGLYIPSAATTNCFTYANRDPVLLGTLYCDGAAAFTQQGGLSLAGLDLGKTGTLILDPVVTDLRLARPPNFAAGAKIALAAKYAASTKGRFLLMTWDAGTLDTSTAAFASLFDTTSAAGVAPALTVETIGDRGYLWLDLDSTATYPTLKVLPLGDSITEGKVSIGNYGNWRITCMKALAAAGYDVQARGFRAINSEDQTGAAMPSIWCSHSGVSGYRIVTALDGGVGHLDTIGALLDQAGDVDVVLMMLGTNDLNGGTDAVTLTPSWSNLVAKIIAARPTVRVVAGTVVDRMDANESKRAQIDAFNASITNLIVQGAFPANQVFVANTHDVAPTNTFFNTLHPDFPGMVAIGQEYAHVTQVALAAPAVAATSWMPTATTGAAANVPADYRNGFKLARVLKPTASERFTAATDPYEDWTANLGAVTNISRVAYYVELKRANTETCDYGGHVRWLWVDMDAWGDCTIREVGFPTASTNQVRVSRLHVASNEPLIASVPPTDDSVYGWIQSAPCNIDVKASGAANAPAHFFGWDWNDTFGTSIYGVWQVHRLTPDATHSATTLFAFNRWARKDDGTPSEVLLGDFAQTLNSRSISGVYTTGLETMNLAAYESMTVEIYTKSIEEDTDARGAIARVDSVSVDGTSATVNGELMEFGTHGTGALVTLAWSEDASFATTTGTAALGYKTELGALTGTATGLVDGHTYYFRFTTVNDRSVTATSANSAAYELATATWRAAESGAVWGDAVWQREGQETLSAFQPSWNARFDGAEASTDGTINVLADILANAVTFDAAKDYTLGGAGRLLGMGPFVKKGTGTLTIDGAGLGTARDVIVSNGVLRLGEHAQTHALGTGGKLEIASGGQLDLNFLPTDPYDSVRVSTTRMKHLVLAGTGPDGRGALVNDAQQAKASFRTLELTGDATIGGTKRIDLRSTATGVENTGNVTITGPGHTLTVANSDWFLATAPQVDVGGITVTNAGIFRTEGATFQPMECFTLVDGGAYHCVVSDTALTAFLQVAGTGGVVMADHALNHTGRFVIDAQTTFFKEGVGTLATAGGFANEGVVKVTAGALDVGGTVPATGAGTYEVSGEGKLVWHAGAANPALDLNVTLTDSAAIELGGWNLNEAYPQFRTVNLAAQGGVVRFVPNPSEVVTNVTITGGGAALTAKAPVAGGRSAMTFIGSQIDVQKVACGQGDNENDYVFTGGASVAAKEVALSDTSTLTFTGDSQLRVGETGFTAARQGDEQRLHLGNASVTATASFASPYGLPLVFGTETNDVVSLDLATFMVRLRTGLVGPAAVSLTATGDGVLRVDDSGKNIQPQGIPTGKWTVSGGREADALLLKGAAGFGDGLEVADNSYARLYISGSNTCALAITYAPISNGTTQLTNAVANAAEPLFTVNNFNLLHTFLAGTDTAAWNKHVYDYTGEFYVDEADLGDDAQHRWSFAGTYDDRIRLEIDGQQVFATTGSGSISSGVVTGMTAGWHAFRITAVDTGGSYGPSADGWKNVCALGWTNGYTTATACAAYRPFTMQSFRAMHPKAGTASRIDWQRVAAPTDLYSAGDAWKTATDWTTNGVVTALSMLSRTDWSLASKALNRFTGWVYVRPADAGAWEVSGSFDDYIDFWLDGKDAGINGRRDTTDVQFGSVGEVTAGWHRFEIRTYDRGGGYGPWTSNDKTIGKHIAIRSTAADGTVVAWRAFDETNFALVRTCDRFGQFLPAGLHGVTKVGAGADLDNEGTLCPIWGTVTGSGTFTGNYAFAGTENALLAQGVSNVKQLADVPTFSGSETTLAGLAGLEVVFDRSPALARYTVCAAQGLTAEAVAGLRLSVTEANGRDHTRAFSAQLVDGDLVLNNACPSGLFLILR